MEEINSAENNRQIRVYIGTTLENFRTCSNVGGNGVVLYDKTKEPRFETNETMWVYGLNGGYIYAHKLALKLNHTPLVITGEINKRYEGGEYPQGKPFEVDKV